MTDKERLEKFKKNRQKKSTALDYIDLDIDWIIEQAEKVEYLQEALNKTVIKNKELEEIKNKYEKALRKISQCDFEGWSGSDILGKVTDFAIETLKN